jgi:hypothetical protein
MSKPNLNCNAYFKMTIQVLIREQGSLIQTWTSWGSIKFATHPGNTLEKC